MTEKSTDLTSFDESVATLSAAAASGVLTILLLAIGFYGYHFGKFPISKDPEVWGQFGDFLGGVVNPAVGFATVLLVIISIHMQKRELRSSISEMRRANDHAKKMSFEQSLFAWLTNYRDLVHSVSVGELSGRRALSELYKKNLTLAEVMAKVMNIGDRGYARLTAHGFATNDLFNPDIQPELKIYIIKARNVYDQIYKDNESELDALPRTLYRLLKWIDESEFLAADRWHYAALVRAQLSWTELALFFYNCYSPHGRAFADLANKYALFDNLNANSDMLIRAVRQGACVGMSEPLQPEAFDSIQAKVRLGIPT